MSVESRLEREERRSRDLALQRDLAALWADACDLYDIRPDLRGPVTVSGPTVTVDNEVLARFLRNLVDMHDA